MRIPLKRKVYFQGTEISWVQGLQSPVKRGLERQESPHSREAPGLSSDIEPCLVMVGTTTVGL